MKQYNLTSLVGSVKQSLLSYMCSSLPVGNHATQLRLGQEFYKRWEEDTFKGPFLEAVPTYRTCTSLAEIFSSEGATSESDKRFREIVQPRYEAEDLHARLSPHGMGSQRIRAHLDSEDGLWKLWQRKLYKHQLKSLAHLLSRRGNLIVATGTGSGKTECFLLPLLYWLSTETDQVRKQPGIRALLLYPMNALVEDQMRRLRTLLSWINGQGELAPSSQVHLARSITFGRYVGTTRVNRSDPSRERLEPKDHIAELGEVLYREDMQKSPPDILITNFSMLEYMLLRNDDKKLFSRPEMFRLLVLDEVHTYRGTQGMEVACLLRRFDDLLQRKSVARTIQYVRVGLSATLPGDPESQKAIAKFATDLFGADFSPNAVIVESPLDCPSSDPESQGPWPQAGAELTRLWNVTPALCKAFAVSCPENVEEDDEIPLDQWQLLAVALESGFAPSIGDIGKARTEILGRILEKSPLTWALREITCTDRVVSLDLVAKRLFGESSVGADPEYALGVLLQLVCAGRLEDRALLSLRAHFFAKEHKEAQVCINPAHLPNNIEDTDGWWKALYLAHHSICDRCGARVYPLNLCRRCGFALLEGWLRKGHYFTERDGLMGEKEFTRVLFRPLMRIPDYLHEKFSEDPPKGTQVQEFRLCVQCGLRISARPTGDTVAATHACGQTQIVGILEWSSPGTDVRILQCPHCDQEWYLDQEVFTPPAVSPYGVATVILEEMKRALDAPLRQSINKVLCFSDNRQQAAKIARRLGRTNEDFVFRQLVFRAIRSSQAQELDTRDLVECLVGTLRMNIGLAEVFCERDESAKDRTLLTRRISTRLFRELCTEYQTLERLGVIQVEYPALLMEQGAEVAASHWLGQKLTPAEQNALFHLLLDWIFRLNRWAVTPCNLDVEEDKLEYYYDKTVALRGQGNALGFLMGNATRLSPRLDFYLRVCGKFPVLQGIADLQGFNKLAEDLWKRAVCNSQFLTPRNARGGPDCDKPFVVFEGSEPGNFRLKANFETFHWRLCGEEEELWRCDNCQYLTRFNVRSVCPVRRCAGQLHPTSVHQVLSEPFSPVRHYIELVTKRTPKPLWVEEHTA